MTGAGSADTAFRVESAYATPDDTGTWYQPGKNITVSDLTIDNQQSRNRDPNNATPSGSREGNLVGSATVEFDLTDANWHDLIPGWASGGGLSAAGNLAPTAEWHFPVTAVDDAGAQFDEFLTTAGTAVQQATVTYEEGGNISVSLSLIFGALSDSNPTEADITRPSDADIYTHHGADVTVGGRQQTGLQSATLTLGNLARRSEQQSRQPRRMVVGAIEPEFESDATFDQPDQLEMALGGSTTSVADLISGEATGEFTHENGNAETITYTLDTLDPTTYSWSNLVAPDTNLTEPVAYHVADVTPSTGAV